MPDSSPLGGCGNKNENLLEKRSTNGPGSAFWSNFRPPATNFDQTCSTFGQVWPGSGKKRGEGLEEGSQDHYQTKKTPVPKFGNKRDRKVTNDCQAWGSFGKTCLSTWPNLFTVESGGRRPAISPKTLMGVYFEHLAGFFPTAVQLTEAGPTWGEVWPSLARVGQHSAKSLFTSVESGSRRPGISPNAPTVSFFEHLASIFRTFGRDGWRALREHFSAFSLHISAGRGR